MPARDDQIGADIPRQSEELLGGPADPDVDEEPHAILDARVTKLLHDQIGQDVLQVLGIFVIDFAAVGDRWQGRMSIDHAREVEGMKRRTGREGDRAVQRGVSTMAKVIANNYLRARVDHDSSCCNSPASE